MIDISGDANLGRTPADGGDNNVGSYAKGTLWVENSTINVAGSLRLCKDLGQNASQNKLSNNGTAGYLYLDNTPFTIGGNVYFSGNINDNESWSKAYAFVYSTVDGRCSGLDLSETSSWLWSTTSATYNKIEITFASDPIQTDADNYYWGLRWKGDQTAALQTRIDNGQLTWTKSGLSVANQALVAMSYDSNTGYTYVGFNVPLSTIFRIR